MHLHGQANVRGDISPLIDYLVEYIDNADITVIYMLRKSNEYWIHIKQNKQGGPWYCWNIQSDFFYF